MSYTPIYKKPYEQWKELPSKETLCTAEVLTQYDDTFEHIEEYLESEGEKEYALVTEAGYSIVASIDEYYVLTVVLKNKAGDVLSTSEPIDLPIESMIINVDYDEESGILTFSLQNGQTLDVNISTLVRGLVPTSRKIAGVDLEDDITAEELKTALSITTLENDVEDLKTRIDEGLKEIEIPEEQLRIGGITNNEGTDNNASILINIIPYLNSFYQIITCDEGYGYRIYAYNVDGSYNGYLIDGMELSKEPAGYDYFTDLTDLNQVRIKYPNYLFKLSMYKLDNSEATLDMINHLHVFSNILEKSDYISKSELDDVKSSIASVSDEVYAVNSRLAYKDISSSIDVGESGCTKVAYVENGQVIVRITYPAGAKGDKRLSIDTAYAPRMTVYGSANGNASDFGKLTTSWISPEGIIFLHATDAPATDMTATFTYPLKSS